VFDPYRKWLAIPPKDQPPNHYRLLGVEVFEDDLDVIESAADKQMTFIRQYQSGEHAADAAKILNELAVARLCLLKRETKAAYDAKLRQQVSHDEFPEVLDLESQGELIPRKRKKKTSGFDQGTMIKVGTGVAGLIVVVILFSSRGGNPPQPIAVDETSAPPNINVIVEPTRPPSVVTATLPKVQADETPKRSAPTLVEVPMETKPPESPPNTPEMTPEPTPPKSTVEVPEKVETAKTSQIGNRQDKVSGVLNAAIATYEKDREAFRASVLEALEKRGSTARTAGDKKTTDQTSAERLEFNSWNVVPFNTPSAIVKRRADASTILENAFNAAIKAYTRAKDDDAAAEMEKKLQLFRGEDWPHLNLQAVKFKGDAFQVGKHSMVSTNAEFSGPIEIHATAKTEKNNIRLYANRGSSVIFNWEWNAKELRVCRPDGREEAETGSIATAQVVPLKPGVWYRLRWRISTDGMTVFVNDQVIFNEVRANDLNIKSKISIAAVESVLDVRDFHVVILTKP